MLTQGSYHLSRFAADPDSEKQRLDAQVELFWAQEAELYRRVGLREGLKVLDCGCGTGHLLHKLRNEFPGIECTGIDQDPQLIATAARNLELLPVCQLVEGSVCSMELPDNEFDVATARLVLEHLPEPGLALKEMFRVLKPGGIAVVIDNDFDLHERTWPDCPSLAPLYEAYRTARRADGGNPCIGRELPGRLATAGFADVCLHLLAAHSQVDGDEAFLKAEGSGIPAQLVRAGYLAPNILNEIAAEWVHMLETPGHSIFRMLFACTGRKPLSNSRIISTTTSVRTTTTTTSSPSNDGGSDGKLESPEDIQRFMRNVLAEDMEVSAESLPYSESLLHLGVNSLSAMRLCNQIKSRMQLSLSMADVLCGKSIEELTRQVLEMRQAVPDAR